MWHVIRWLCVTSFDTPLTWWFMYFVAFTEPFWLHLSFLFDLTFDVISRTYVTTWCLCGIFLEQIWRHCTRDDVITWSRLHLNAHMIVRWPADDVILLWHNLILSIENSLQSTPQNIIIQNIRDPPTQFLGT